MFDGNNYLTINKLKKILIKTIFLLIILLIFNSCTKNRKVVKMTHKRLVKTLSKEMCRGSN